MTTSNLLPRQAPSSRRNTSRLAIIFAAMVAAALLAYPASAQFHVQLPTPSPAQPPAQPEARPALPRFDSDIAPTPVQAKDWPAAEAAALVALRGSSSPAEKKLSFNLFLLSRKVRKGPLGSFATMLNSSQVGADGMVMVDINAYLSPSLMASPVMLKIVRENGGISRSAYESDHLRARVSQSELLDLASNPNVLSITDFETAKPVAALAATEPATSAAR